MDMKRWLAMLTVLLSSNAAMGAETAQRQEPFFEKDKKTERFFEALPLPIKTNDVGVYYVPPPDAGRRGFIFDDIPRDSIITQAQLTEKRIKKEGTFVKFNHRQISYSLMETRDDSVRMNYYPTKGAIMLNWTHAIPVLGDF